MIPNENEADTEQPARQDTAYAELRALAEKATPGPWHIVYGDDHSHMCMTAITNDQQRTHNAGPFEDREQLVAITFHQTYPVVDCENPDDCGDANSQYIAAANPAAILTLLADNDRLTERVRDLETVSNGIVAGTVSFMAKERAAQDERVAVLEAPSEPVMLPFAILADEMKALQRFDECVRDDQGYDVPKEMMRRLAVIGLLRRVTAGIYEHTNFGLSVLNGDFHTPHQHAGKAANGVLVPPHVTNAMIDAFNDVPCGFGGSPTHVQHQWDALLASAPKMSSADACTTDAARYRLLRRKVAIVGRKFHILNLAPTYCAPCADAELDAVIDAALTAPPSPAEGKSA